MRGVCSWKQEPVCLRRFRACRTGAWTDPVSAPQVPSCPGLPGRQAPAIRYRHSQLVGDTTSSVFGPYGVMPSCWMWAALPRKSRSSAMRPCSRCATVAMAASVSARRLDHLVSHFMGLVNLTSNTSTMVVHLRGVSVCDNVRLSGANDAHTFASDADRVRGNFHVRCRGEHGCDIFRMFLYAMRPIPIQAGIETAFRWHGLPHTRASWHAERDVD